MVLLGLLLVNPVVLFALELFSFMLLIPLVLLLPFALLPALVIFPLVKDWAVVNLGVWVPVPDVDVAELFRDLAPVRLFPVLNEVPLAASIFLGLERPRVIFVARVRTFSFFDFLRISNTTMIVARITMKTTTPMATQTTHPL